MTKTDKKNKHGDREKTIMPFWKRLLLDFAAIFIVAILVLSTTTIFSYFKIKKMGFENKDKLIQTYFEGLNDTDKSKMELCFYPNTENGYDSINSQIKYAKSETDKTVWNFKKIKTNWEAYDIKTIQKNIGNIPIEEAAKCIAFVPIKQTTSSGVTVLEEDVYQFYAHKTDNRWYIASFMQTARNVTGAIKADGTIMTDGEMSQWLYSMATEIGNDKIGYLYVDSYWSETKMKDAAASDDQIKAFITADSSSYMTMAIIKDTDIADFNAYAKNIIKTSSKKYGDILSSDGVVGKYNATVRIAENKDTGARIIIWVFKTPNNAAYTHVITLEATSDYDASTYINTFHLSKGYKDIDTTSDTISGNNVTK